MVFLKNRNSISDIVKQRKILWLCHFTPIENLDNIKKNGLKLRNELVMKVTDENRADCSNNICLSISEPNKWMFNFKKKQGYNLVLLIINPNVLFEKKCLFFPYNAATKSYRSISNEYLSTPEALNDMFSEKVIYKKSCQDLKIINRNPFFPDFLTTTEQAEVQLVEDIEAKYIEHIFCDNIPLTYSDIQKRIKDDIIHRLLSIAQPETNYSESKNNIENIKRNPNKIVITSDIKNVISKTINSENKNIKGLSIEEKVNSEKKETSDYDGCIGIIIILLVLYFFIF